ncbi:MAG TPA: hypothetical protein VFN88_01920 [Caulobacteraceae bacterium]|nr:hypothetical protein [Caulobacteraceae bacterium]
MDHIAFPPPNIEAPPEAVVERAIDAAPARRRGIAGGLLVGLLGGASAGAAAGLFVLHKLDQERPKPTTPSQVLAQALTVGVRPAVIPAPPGPTPAQRPVVPENKARRVSDLDLDRLARTIASATPPPQGDATAVAPVQPPPVIEAPPPQASAGRVSPAPAPPITAPPVIIARASEPPAQKLGAPPRPAPPTPLNDRDLAEAQQRLTLAYDRAMASAPDRAALHAEQERWNAQRTRLAGDKAALLSFYQARIDALLDEDRIERKKGGIGRLLRD